MVFARELPDGTCVTDRKETLDVDVIHRDLSQESYWARDRTRAVTEATIAGSLCVGLFAPDGA